jgi:hypothetical protein
MLDNGAFSEWKRGRSSNWPEYYLWAEEWMNYPTTWAVIPDVIDGTDQQQNDLIAQWPFGIRGAPVWHMNESIARVLSLCDRWPRVCIGSTAIYATILSDSWQRRMDETFNEIAKRHHPLPWIHMLRGMDCSGRRWPFASVDSTDIARNHHLDRNTPRKMADRWDAMQCPSTWSIRHHQLEFVL